MATILVISGYQWGTCRMGTAWKAGRLARHNDFFLEHVLSAVYRNRDAYPVFGAPVVSYQIPEQRTRLRARKLRT